MSGVEIFLLIIGAVLVIASFVFNDLFSKGSEQSGIDNAAVRAVSEEIIKQEVEYELAEMIDNKVDETEAKLEKISNEKTMELGNYSDKVLEEINKNHTEVMFLYDMLTEKEETLKNTIKDIETLKTSVKQMAIVNDFAKQAANKKVANDDTSTHAENAVSRDSDKETKAEVVQSTLEKEAAWANKENKNNNQMILALYNKGKTDIEIARELGLGIGEVKVVIKLFNSSREGSR